MKTNTFMIALMAFVAVFAVGFTSAADIVNGEAIVSIDGIEINHGAHNLTLAAFAGETVPVRVYFTADSFAKDVKVKVEISSGSKDYSDSYFLGNVLNDSRVYRTGVMNIQIPSNLKDTTKDIYLRVIITSDGFDTYMEEYTILAQRESYVYDFVAVDFDATASAGDTVPVSVVIKNRGFEEMEDGFVLVSIPALGIASKAFLGDLVALEDCSDDCDDEDTVQKILQLKIPSDVKAGVYEVVTKVYNDESSTTVKELISIDSSASTQAIASTSNKEMKAGETSTYELILVNSADSIKVFTLRTVSSSDLDVSVPSVVTVGPDQSKVVEITVTASEDAKQGEYTFTVDVDGKTVVYTADVKGKASSFSLSAVALTVILSIIFVALLVVLLVLLFKKDKPVQEVETSYY